jgi:hypothetical protein
MLSTEPPHQHSVSSAAHEHTCWGNATAAGIRTFWQPRYFGIDLQTLTRFFACRKIFNIECEALLKARTFEIRRSIKFGRA